MDFISEIFATFGIPGTIIGVGIIALLFYSIFFSKRGGNGGNGNSRSGGNGGVGSGSHGSSSGAGSSTTPPPASGT